MPVKVPVILGPDGRPAQRRSARRIAARFDAVQTVPENRNHWRNADALSAACALTPAVRREMRIRSRYEVQNNSYAKGIVRTLANDTIGTGPRLQLLTQNSDFNRAVEREFRDWSNRVGLAAILRLMRTSIVQDGETFAMFITNLALAGDVKLDIRIVEADQVADPTLQPVATSSFCTSDGIVFDDFGNPLAYRILREHPGGPFAGEFQEFDVAQADNVIHMFRVERGGQLRGIPELLPALPLFAQLRRYTLAVIAAAEAAADVAGVISTQQSPEDPDDDGFEPFDPVEMEARTFLTMPRGWTINQLKAEQPKTTYETFRNAILNEIARCLNMPFNVAAGNSAGYNFASGRLDHKTYFKSILVDRHWFETVALDRIFSKWAGEAAAVGLFDVLSDPASRRHSWHWDGMEHVDPQKEATAENTKLSNGSMTYAESYARRGFDWEEAFRQRAREEELASELNISLAGAGDELPASVLEDIRDGVEAIQ